MPRTGQVIAWISLWCFWVGFSRNNHPTLLIDGVTTLLLLAAFAAAIYFNWLVLVPRCWRSLRFLMYWTCLLLAMTILTAVGVVSIQKAYDFFWRPDPRRFSLWVNYGLDFIGMSAHLLAAAVALWLIRRLRHSAAA